MRIQRSNKSHGGSTLRAFSFSDDYYYDVTTIILVKVKKRTRHTGQGLLLPYLFIRFLVYLHRCEPLYLFLICLPYVCVRTLRPGISFFSSRLLSFSPAKNWREDQQLAIYFFLLLRWLLFKANMSITTRSLMVPHYGEETREEYIYIYTCIISYVREHYSFLLHMK